MDIAKRLQQIRNRKKISIYKLSKLSDVSENYIRSIEKGINQPSIYILEKLLKAMGITIMEFFNEDLNIYYLNTFEEELLESIRSLTKQQAAIILELTKAMN